MVLKVKGDQLGTPFDISDSLITISGSLDNVDIYTANGTRIYGGLTVDGVQITGNGDIYNENNFSILSDNTITISGNSLSLIGDITIIGTLDIEDDSFRILNSADNTKEIAFSATEISPSTIRTVTMPDSDVDLGDIATLNSHVADDSIHVKVMVSGTTAPTTANDNTQGYSAGSLWVDTVNDRVYTCLDSATSAALWVPQNNVFTNTLDPTVDDDESLGMGLGTKWLNTVTREEWRCWGGTDGAAVWTRGGTGNVDGPYPSTVTDNTIVRWDGTDGRLIQGSTVTVDDLDGITAAAASGTGHNITVDLSGGGDIHGLLISSDLSAIGFDVPPGTPGTMLGSNSNGILINGLLDINEDVSFSVYPASLFGEYTAKINISDETTYTNTVEVTESHVQIYSAHDPGSNGVNATTYSPTGIVHNITKSDGEYGVEVPISGSVHIGRTINSWYEGLEYDGVNGTVNLVADNANAVRIGVVRNPSSSTKLETEFNVDSTGATLYGPLMVDATYSDEGNYSGTILGRVNAGMTSQSFVVASSGTAATVTYSEDAQDYVLLFPQSTDNYATHKLSIPSFFRRNDLKFTVIGSTPVTSGTVAMKLEAELATEFDSLVPSYDFTVTDTVTGNAADTLFVHTFTSNMAPTQVGIGDPSELRLKLTRVGTSGSDTMEDALIITSLVIEEL